MAGSFWEGWPYRVIPKYEVNNCYTDDGVSDDYIVYIAKQFCDGFNKKYEDFVISAKDEFVEIVEKREKKKAEDARKRQIHMVSSQGKDIVNGIENGVFQENVEREMYEKLKVKYDNGVCQNDANNAPS